MRRLLSLAMFGALVAPSPAAAQEADLSGPAGVPPAPAGRSDGVVAGPTFDLEISGDESSASVEFGGYLRDDGPDGNHQINASWSVKLGIPIGGKDDLTAQSTLDALRNGPEVTLGYSWYSFESTADRLRSQPFLDLMEQARVACRERAAPGSNPMLCNPPGPVQSFARQYMGDAAVARILNRDIWRYGIEGSAGVNRFGHIEAGTIDEHHDMELQLSASAFVAWYPANGTNALIGRAEFQDAYEAADDAIICRPVVVTPATDCVTGAPTPPEHIQRLNASLEYRQVFDLTGDRFRLAVSPRGTVDTLSGDYRVELPIYLIPRRDSQFLPGVNIAYSSEKDEVTFGIFLRASFALTK